MGSVFTSLPGYLTPVEYKKEIRIPLLEHECTSTYQSRKRKTTINKKEQALYLPVVQAPVASTAKKVYAVDDSYEKLKNRHSYGKRIERILKMPGANGLEE